MKRSQRNNTARVPKAIDRSNNIRAAKFPVLSPKTANQKYFVESLNSDSVVVGAGFAGVGKTLMGCYHAAHQLYHGKVTKIILLRAYQPLAGRTIGFTPGDALEKLLPHYQQMIDYLEGFLGKSQVEIFIKKGTIEVCSLETIRGRSWEDAIVIVDESQNLYIEEVQALTTRVGNNCQLIMIGDDSGVQTDVVGKTNGLSYLLSIVEKYEIPDVGVTYFDIEDILRSGVTKAFVLAYDKELQESKRKNK
jgi:phosphate starvation-inducible PhoH-like protein